MNLRGFADEIHLRHDAVDEEHKAVAEIFDRLRKEKREEKLTKSELQEFMADFKEMIRAERKYGRDLIGYEAKNERVRSLAALVYGNPSRRIEPPAPIKRTLNLPGANEGPSENSLRARARDDKSPPSQSVASPSPRSQSDGAAVSNRPADPSDTAAGNSEIEGAARSGPHLNGRIEPLGNDGLDAPSSLPDDGDVRGSPFDRNRVEA